MTARLDFRVPIRSGGSVEEVKGSAMVAVWEGGNNGLWRVYNWKFEILCWTLERLRVEHSMYPRPRPETGRGAVQHGVPCLPVCGRNPIIPT